MIIDVLKILSDSIPYCSINCSMVLEMYFFFLDDLSKIQCFLNDLTGVLFSSLSFRKRARAIYRFLKAAKLTFFHLKNMNIFFSNFAQDVDCGYTLEPF